MRILRHIWTVLLLIKAVFNISTVQAIEEVVNNMSLCSVNASSAAATKSNNENLNLTLKPVGKHARGSFNKVLEANEAKERKIVLFSDSYCLNPGICSVDYRPISQRFDVCGNRFQSHKRMCTKYSSRNDLCISIPVAFQAAPLLAAFAHPDHLQLEGSRGFAHLPPRCSIKCFEYIGDRQSTICKEGREGDGRHFSSSFDVPEFNTTEQVDLYAHTDTSLAEERELLSSEQVLEYDQKFATKYGITGYYAGDLIINTLADMSLEEGLAYTVNSVLANKRIIKRRHEYASIIQLYSDLYDIEESLIYAIIRTESDFNPYAFSNSKACGLMQIIPHAAGKDVFARVKKISGCPSQQYLFEPHSNIETGTAYLYLLNTHYLKEIEHPLTRTYIIISAYNGGIRSALAAFDKNSKRAIIKINEMEPAKVYQVLTTQHPRGESRRYLEKVTSAQRDFYQQYVFRSS